MKVYIGNKEIELIKDGQDSNYITSGTECDIYRVDDYAVKVYNSLSYKKIGPVAVDRLSEIKTQKVLMPQEKVYDEDYRYEGYVTKFIDSDSAKTDYLKLLKMKEFLGELRAFESDVDKLTSENVEVSDMTTLNIIISKNGMFMIDPDKFELSELSNGTVKKRNFEELRRLFVNEMLGWNFYINRNVDQKTVDSMLSCDKLSDVIESIVSDENETVHSFARKMINRR